MIRSTLIERVSQELPQRQAVFATPRDASLRINTLKVPHKDHAEIHARRNTVTATLFVKGLAQRFGKIIELSITEHTIQGVIKHMSNRRRQFRRRHPQFLLPLSITLGYGVGCVVNMGLMKKYGKRWIGAVLVPIAAGFIVGEALTALVLTLIRLASDS